MLGQLNTGIKKRLWRMEQGSRNSKLYYAINKPPVSALVRQVATKPLTGTSRVTSSAIDSDYPEPLETGPVVPCISTPSRWNAGTGLG